MKIAKTNSLKPFPPITVRQNFFQNSSELFKFPQNLSKIFVKFLRIFFSIFTKTLYVFLKLF